MNPSITKRAVCVLVAACFGSLLACETSRLSAEPANAKLTSQTPKVDQPSAPLSQRFAAETTEEVPDFQKHVVPLMGRLGCNGRACHGSFQGRGGFQLSLFGYDFKADHQALLDESSGRVDVDDIDESLILAKPTDADMHEGGKRYDAGSWQHHVLRRWIEAGAKFDSDELQTLVRLDVTPSEIRFTGPGEEVQLTAVAHWQDGTVEDVTELCRFSSNDDAVVEIDKSGHLKSGVRGDSHVVVFYDNAVVPVPVMRPVEQLSRKNLPSRRSQSTGSCSRSLTNWASSRRASAPTPNSSGAFPWTSPVSFPPAKRSASSSRMTRPTNASD